MTMKEPKNHKDLSKGHLRIEKLSKTIEGTSMPQHANKKIPKSIEISKGADDRLQLNLDLKSSKISSKKTPIDPSHIKIDDDIYLKPLGKNEKGCSIFSPYSISDQGIVQVIYFLDQDGNPTTISNPKGCL